MCSNMQKSIEKKEIKDKNKVYHEENADKMKQHKNEYYQIHKEREQARAREYQHNNREEVRESNRQYYARNKHWKENKLYHYIQ